MKDSFLLKNTFLNLVYQIIVAIFGIFVTTYLYKTIDSTSFVIFGYLSIALFFLNYTNFGIAVINTREVAQYYKDFQKINFKQINASLYSNFFICLLICFLTFLIHNSALDFYRKDDFFIPLYGVIINYFLQIHIRSSADGIGNFNVSRNIKSLFYISFYLAAFITHHNNLDSIANLLILMLFSIFLFFVALKDYSSFSFQNLKPLIFNNFIQGLPFFVIAIISGLIGYIDRFFIGFYLSASLLASMLYIIDISSRQSLIGTALSNITFKYFMSSSEEKSRLMIQKIINLIILYAFLTSFGIFVFKEEILIFLNLQDNITISVILNIWIGFALMLINTIQYQKIISSFLENKWKIFIICELILLVPLIYILFDINAVLFISIIIYLRASIQILFADLIVRDLKYFLYLCIMIAFCLINFLL